MNDIQNGKVVLVINPKGNYDEYKAGITTLGELKASGWKSITVKDEIRKT